MNSLPQTQKQLGAGSPAESTHKRSDGILLRTTSSSPQAQSQSDTAMPEHIGLRHTKLGGVFSASIDWNLMVFRLKTASSPKRTSYNDGREIWQRSRGDHFLLQSREVVVSYDHCMSLAAFQVTTYCYKALFENPGPKRTEIDNILF